MGHIFCPRAKAAETQVENATQELPAWVNWRKKTKSGHFTPNWDFLQLWSVSIGMSVRSPNMKSNCLPCLLESSRYFIASPTITFKAGLTSFERKNKMSESGKNTFSKNVSKPCFAPPYNRGLLRPHLACALSQPPSRSCPAQPWLPVHYNHVEMWCVFFIYVVCPFLFGDRFN